MREHSSYQTPQRTTADPVADHALALVDRWQAELDALREQLAASNRLSQLGMLTAVLAHETNNLLTPIRSYAQLALGNPDDPATVQRALRAAVQGTDKIAELAERMMELAKPNQPIQTGVCDCSAAASSAIAAMAPLTRQQGVRVEVGVEPTSVRIDALSLEQVLINLIGNACQAMRDTPGQHRVRIASQREHERVVLSVSDTGPGIPAGIREQLFDAFVTSKGHDPTASAEPPSVGSGLGLSICQQLVESAGGEITLASTSHRGSTFEITLPTASTG